MTAMKILEPQSAALSNAEVLAHIKEMTSEKHAKEMIPRKLKSPNYETVVKELTSALAPTGSSPVPPYMTRYDATHIRSLMLALKKFRLTKAELIMIINLRPQEIVFLDIIIEECDVRLTGDQQAEVLEIIGQNLGERETVAV